MAARLTASSIALVVFLTGVIPAVAGYRCVVMGARMQAPSSCCHREDQATAFRAQCCEAVAAPRIEPRRTQASSETRIQAPTLVAWLGPLALTMPSGSREPSTTARARGRPPGEQLQLLSTILRI